MSNRTWVCVDCGKSYRRHQGTGGVSCSICGRGCEYVHWKIHIPSPKRAKAWAEFWEKYRREKRLIERFEADSSIKEIFLEIMNERRLRG
ncbi:hypothetical protein [Sorangium sp. So ce131]|uniref:hypothetical protein n=1 Tax=Sorangium sp. So ce131 TaxID=3133282 RepID=UPI003F61EF5E